MPAGTLADRIEAHLLRLLAERRLIEMQRTELAQRFACAPSQINYVLDTRFTTRRGFLVESRRGGGGFIRLVRVPAERGAALAELPAALAQAEAEQYIARLCDEGLCDERLAAVMRAAVDREAIALPLPIRDEVRGRLLRAMVGALLRAAAAEEAGRA